MARLAYLVTLAIVGTLLTMLDGAQFVVPATVEAAPIPDAAVTGSLTTSAPVWSASPAPTAAAPTGRDIAGARVVIGRLDIDLPLEWGDITRDVPRTGYAGATPERVALVFPGSALPDAGGNTYIYAHARTGMFLSLWGVKPGDIVVLRWPDSELRYAVQQVVPRVPVTDTSWLDPAGPERLTLQTSTGPNAADPRFVAVALRVGQ